MGTYTLQLRDEGPDSRRPCGRLCRPTPVPGHPLGGRRVRRPGQVPRLQDARGPGQAGESGPGRGQLPERPPMLMPPMMPSPVMLRLLAATPTRPPHLTRDPTMLTTERTPAATVPSAGTPTTPFFSPGTKVQVFDLRVSPSTVIVTE